MKTLNEQFSRTGHRVTRRNGYTYTQWRWVHVETGRNATAAESRKLNQWAANNPPAMALPSTHPSYRA